MSKLQSNTLSDGKRVEFYTVSLSSSLSSLKAYYILASAEASSSMARYDGMQYGKIICLFKFKTSHHNSI